MATKHDSDLPFCVQVEYIPMYHCEKFQAKVMLGCHSIDSKSIGTKTLLFIEKGRGGSQIINCFSVLLGA